jgi:hypothetical protein
VSLILLAEGAIVHQTQLPMPGFLFGVIAMAGFIALALITWSYRDVSNRNYRRGERAGH